MKLYNIGIDFRTGTITEKESITGEWVKFDDLKRYVSETDDLIRKLKARISDLEDRYERPFDDREALREVFGDHGQG